jgi:hypothetical protein
MAAAVSIEVHFLLAAIAWSFRVSLFTTLKDLDLKGLRKLFLLLTALKSLFSKMKESAEYQS